MNKKREYRIECPGSMMGEIDLDDAHDLFTTADKKRFARLFNRAVDAEFRATIDQAAQWIDRYLRSDEYEPLPSGKVQRQSRKALLGGSRDLVESMNSADRETRKRIYHYLADNPPKGAPDRKGEDTDYDYGHRMYRCLRRNLRVLSRAVADSKRNDDSKGQAAPATYLIYELTLIWIDLADYRVSANPDKFPQKEAWQFCAELLEAAQLRSSEQDEEKLAALLQKFPTSTFTAISRKLARAAPHRDTRPKKKSARSDDDTQQRRKANT